MRLSRLVSFCLDITVSLYKSERLKKGLKEETLKFQTPIVAFATDWLRFIKLRNGCEQWIKGKIPAFFNTLHEN